MAQLVEALCYKPEGRGFDSRWCHWNFLLTLCKWLVDAEKTNFFWRGFSRKNTIMNGLVTELIQFNKRGVSGQKYAILPTFRLCCLQHQG